MSLAKKVVDPSISHHFLENIRFIFTYPAIAVRDWSKMGKSKIYFCKMFREDVQLIIKFDRCLTVFEMAKRIKWFFVFIWFITIWNVVLYLFFKIQIFHFCSFSPRSWTPYMVVRMQTRKGFPHWRTHTFQKVDAKQIQHNNFCATVWNDSKGSM